MPPRLSFQRETPSPGRSGLWKLGPQGVPAPRPPTAGGRGLSVGSWWFRVHSICQRPGSGAPCCPRCRAWQRRSRPRPTAVLRAGGRCQALHLGRLWRESSGQPARDPGSLRTARAPGTCCPEHRCRAPSERGGGLRAWEGWGQTGVIPRTFTEIPQDNPGCSGSPPGRPTRPLEGSKPQGSGGSATGSHEA